MNSFKKSLILAFIFLPVCIAQAQPDGGKKQNFTLSKAIALFNDANYPGCLYVLEHLMRSKGEDPEMNYYAGRSNLEEKNYKEAFPQLMLSAQKDPKKFKDIKFWQGRAFQEIHEPDSALAYYNSFKANTKGTLPEYLETDYYIAQCENYKKFKANPVKVKFKNLGDKINSDQEETSPSINAEGNIMIFTSRRSNTTGGERDPNDGKYYQDIYMSIRDSVTGLWTEAVNMKRVNSPEHDANMTITPDGNNIFVYKNVTGKTGSGDIWISRSKGEDDWSKPKEFEGPFNTSYFETSASMAPSGKTLFFISERPDGKPMGNGDIWMCERISRKEWGKPVNMGAPINSTYDEVNVVIHPDGRTLFFSSKGHNSMGGYDIFKTELVNGKWTAPVNLGYPINTPADEIHFTVTADGKKAYLSTRREDSEGDLDIYEVDLSEYAVLSPETGKPDGNKGAVANGGILSVFKGKVTDGATPIQASLSIADEKTGSVVQKIDTDDNGLFFITIEGGKRYKVTITAEGFQSSTESIYLSKKEGSVPYTLNKTFTLMK